LPADHADRKQPDGNSGFSGKVAIPDSQILTIPAELGRNKLLKNIKIVANALPFDMVLLAWVKMVIPQLISRTSASEG